LRDEDITYGSFRRELKTFCFNVASGAQLRYINTLTYLLTLKLRQQVYTEQLNSAIKMAVHRTRRCIGSRVFANYCGGSS